MLSEIFKNPIPHCICLIICMWTHLFRVFLLYFIYIKKYVFRWNFKKLYIYSTVIYHAYLCSGFFLQMAHMVSSAHIAVANLNRNHPEFVKSAKRLHLQSTQKLLIADREKQTTQVLELLTYPYSVVFNRGWLFPVRADIPTAPAFRKKLHAARKEAICEGRTSPAPAPN